VSVLRFKEKERLEWQCRRGMLELDYLLNRFLQQQYDQQPEEVKTVFRNLLTETDPQLFHWLMTAPDSAPGSYRGLLEKIRDDKNI
jgi:antitoxin CptB